MYLKMWHIIDVAKKKNSFQKDFFIFKIHFFLGKKIKRKNSFLLKTILQNKTLEPD
jgi:hypothetical protein